MNPTGSECRDKFVLGLHGAATAATHQPLFALICQMSS